MSHPNPPQLCRASIARRGLAALEASGGADIIVADVKQQPKKRWWVIESQNIPCINLMSHDGIQGDHAGDPRAYLALPRKI